MSEGKYKPYTAKRWTEIPAPKVVGQIEFSEEEKRENELKAEEALKAYGILQPNEHLRDGKVVKE